MGAKRQAPQQARAGKKAKLDPVSAKVKEVLDALQRDDCEVAGNPTFREGLVAAFPLAMGLGAAKDERHAYQEKVGNIVFEFLEASKAKLDESQKVARDEHAAAEGLKSTKEATVTKAEEALEEHKKVEAESKESLVSSVEAVIEARKKLEEASSEVDTFDSTQLAKAKERAEYGSALETEFAALKDGTIEDAKEKKTTLSALNAVLHRLGVDQALVKAADPALTKGPAARGGFDITVVEQVESALTARVDSLAEDLNNGETIKASKVAAQAAAQEALDEAEKTKAADQTKLSEAEAQTKESKTALKQAKDSLKEQEKIVADLDVKAFYIEAHIDNYRDAVAAFEFLRDRESIIPETDAKEMVAMEGIAMDAAPVSVA